MKSKDTWVILEVYPRYTKKILENWKRTSGILKVYLKYKFKNKRILEVYFKI